MSPIAECVECRAESADIREDQAKGWGINHMNEKNPPGTRVMDKRHTRIKITGARTSPYGFDALSQNYVYPGQLDAEKYGLEGD